jgi:hypothetical protein
LLVRRRPVDPALFAVVMQAYVTMALTDQLGDAPPGRR